MVSMNTFAIGFIVGLFLGCLDSRKANAVPTMKQNSAWFSDNFLEIVGNDWYAEFGADISQQLFHRAVTEHIENGEPINKARKRAVLELTK